MANLPEKNITTVDKITSIPSNANLYINANGEFRQATVDDVLKVSPVIADSITNQYKNASGSPILLTDSAEGVAIDFDVYGRSKQTQYSGKNKLKNIGTTQTLNGGTFTVNEDKSVTVNGTFTETSYIQVGSNFLKSEGTYIFNGAPSGSSATTYYQYCYIGNTQKVDTGKGVTIDYTDDTLTTSAWIIVLKGVTVPNITFYPMISVEGGDYEPYVGGTASPNPEYPQAIKSVGDMGYFDGELLQGGRSTDNGAHNSGTAYVVTSKNKIPCKQGDIVTIHTDDNPQFLAIVYFNGDTFVNANYEKNVNESSFTVPSGVDSFHFNVQMASTETITPQTTKHICVTINDKYALIVDSVGKNELNNTATSQTINGVTFTVNEDKSVTVNGTATADALLTLGSTTAKRGHNYRLTGCPSGGSASTYYIYVSFIIDYYNQIIDIGNGAGTGALSGDATLVSRIMIKSGTTINATFHPMLRRAEITDATYEPYIHSRKYIPISAPLRGLGEVTDVASLSECEVTRKFAEVVFDGSDDEGWTLSTNRPSIGIADIKQTVEPIAICAHFKNVKYGTNVGEFFNFSNGYIYFVVSKELQSLNDWRTWLQANPITVIYELAEPTTESIEPIDVDTFEGVTQISVSDDAEMEVEYPTSKVAGIASIGWSKGRRAEYDLEQLKVQMLALQTTIVSTV